MDTDVKKLKDRILSKSEELGYDINTISRALKEAETLHHGQTRKSGEPYIIHPFHVALEIIDLDLGTEAVCASLLHDTIEDCGVTKKDIEAKFGAIVAELVEGVTKIDALAHDSTTRFTELMNVRKLIISSSHDIRVLLIKLADRLHNMRTIDALSATRQSEYSDETLKVYVPLAEYIGAGKWKRELEDIAFRKKEPVMYEKIKYMIEHDKRIHAQLLSQIIKDLNKLVYDENLDIERIYGRVKSVHATHNKIFKYYSEGKILDILDFDLTRIKDLLAVSIILNTSEIDCYKVLGLIHAKFEHLPKEFDDYIAKPKANGYRALQTTIKYKQHTVEVQIKTLLMHEVNEFGPASHIAYKLSGKRNAKSSSQFDWIKNLSSWSDKTLDTEKFKLNAFKDKIFAITPKGRVLELKKGATVIDFAYLVHTEVGNKFIGAKVNDSIAKAETKLENGDVVEILTSKTTKKPSLVWLKFAYLNSTKQKIRHQLKLQERENIIEKGRTELVDYILKSIHIDWLTLDTSVLKYLCGEFGATDIDAFYSSVHYGNIPKKEVLKKLVKKLNLQTEQQDEVLENEIVESKSRIIVEGEGELDFKLAGCCKPMFGDPIVGLVTLRDGLKIHRKVCPDLKNIDKERILAARWNKAE